MERIMAKYYPVGGPRITLAYLKDKIANFPFNQKDLYVKAYRMGIAGNHKSKTQFKPGHVPWSKGKTGLDLPHLKEHQYKAGHISPRELPIGSTKLQSTGYLWIKVQQRPTKWKQLHIYLWEQTHGAIPKGKLLWFIDNNPENCCLENLACGTRGELFKLKVQIHNPKHQKQIA